MLQSMAQSGSKRGCAGKAGSEESRAGIDSGERDTQTSGELLPVSNLGPFIRLFQRRNNNQVRHLSVVLDG